MASKTLGCVLLALLCAGVLAEENKYQVPEPTIEVFQPKGFRATIPDAAGLVYFLVQGQLIRNDNKEDFHGGETGSKINIDGKDVWVVDLPDVELKKGDQLNYLAFVAINNDGYVKDSLTYTVNSFDTFTALPERPKYPGYGCEPTDTQVHQGSACAGQVIFEENFDKLSDVWEVLNYIPNDHPEVPFVSYEKSAVTVRDGHLHITTHQRLNDSDSLYTSLDLSEGCTSGDFHQCKVDAGKGRPVPPVVSGRVTSKHNFAFKYGVVTVRAKLPKGNWIYPEILLEPFFKKFGIDSRNTGILKIASARGNADLNKRLDAGPVLDTRCYDTLLKHKDSENLWSTDFHEYTVKWTPDSLVLSVDGEEYATVKPEASGLRGSLPSTCDGVQAAGIAPFDDFFYLTLGVAVGGDYEFADSPDKPWKNKEVKAPIKFWQDVASWKTSWEQPELVVDYVKVVAL